MKPARELTYTDAYMEEYYASLTEENQEIGEFLRESVSDLPDLAGAKRLVDVACGPSALYWALFMEGFDEYHGLDAREDNMAALRDEVGRCRKGEMHERYRDVCEFVTKKASKPGKAHPCFKNLCEKVGTLKAHDLSTGWPYADGFADAVTSIFGLEHLDTKKDFQAALGEAERIVKPGGRIVMVCLCMTSPWLFRGEPIHVLHLTEASLRKALAKAGFTDIFVERRAATTAIELNQGYDAMLFAHARKPD